MHDENAKLRRILHNERRRKNLLEKHNHRLAEEVSRLRAATRQLESELASLRGVV